MLNISTRHILVATAANPRPPALHGKKRKKERKTKRKKKENKRKERKKVILSLRDAIIVLIKSHDQCLLKG